MSTPTLRDKIFDTLLKFGLVTPVSHHHSAAVGALADLISYEAIPVEEKKEECKHEYGNIAYLSNPPQYKCIKCGEFTTNKYSQMVKQKPIEKLEAWDINLDKFTQIKWKINELVDFANSLTKQS